jgi:hypothetical protein
VVELVVVVELLVSLVWLSVFWVVVLVAKVMVVGLLMFINLGVPFRVVSGAHERARRGEKALLVRLPDVGHAGQGEVVKRAGGYPQLRAARML